MPNVWVVVLTWNGREDTLALLSDLTRQPLTVVVVDNASVDGTLEAVRSLHPRVYTVQTGANLGYAGGNNAGIRFALERGAEVVGVLNNDTLVSDGFLEPLIDALADSDAAVSPDIRYAASPDQSWFRGARLDRSVGWPQHLAPVDQPPNTGGSVATPVLTGCCLFAAAETWRTVGLFDERLFLIFEDFDWSMRARKAGVSLLVVPASRIRHRVSRSFTGAAAALGQYYFVRNGLIFATRHLGFVPAAHFMLHEVVRPAVAQLRRRRASVMPLLAVLAAAGGIRGPAGRLTTAVATRSARRAAGQVSSI